MKRSLCTFVLPFALVGLLACGSAEQGSGATGGAGATGGNGGMGGMGGMGGIGGSPSTERRVFVTSTGHTAALDGIIGADKICANQAADADLDGEFKAWLSTTSSSVVGRLSHDGGPFVRVDGIIVATDWADLLDGDLLAPINLDATSLAHSVDVWTGTLATGASYTVSDCAHFTSGNNDDGHGYCGRSTSTTSTWTYNQRAACSVGLHLYCIEE